MRYLVRLALTLAMLAAIAPPLSAHHIDEPLRSHPIDVTAQLQRLTTTRDPFIFDAAAGRYILPLTLTFQNRGADFLGEPFFRIDQLSGPGCPCTLSAIGGVGATVTIDAGSDGRLGPNETFTHIFEIQATHPRQVRLRLSTFAWNQQSEVPGRITTTVRFVKGEGATDKDVEAVKLRFDRYTAVKDSVLKAEIEASALERNSGSLVVQVTRGSGKTLFGSALVGSERITIDLADFERMGDFMTGAAADKKLVIDHYLEAVLVHEVRHTSQANVLPDIHQSDAISAENRAWKQLTSDKVQRVGDLNAVRKQEFTVEGRTVLLDAGAMERAGLGGND